MINKLLLITTIFLLSASAIAQNGTIAGTVLDAETRHPLEGANVVLISTGIGKTTNASGKFELNMPEGNYQLSVSFLGYKVNKQSLQVLSGKEIILRINLIPTVLNGQSVEVTGMRASERQSPVAFTNLKADDIEKRYWAQDIPMMLSELPNVYSYSDNGNGIGYSYMKMRGFGQNRIAVLLNGIPLNDAESHEVFWVNLPDFSASTQDIQVQRGVGTSLYGASAFGGSVNLLTKSASQVPQIEVIAGTGSYNTKKYSVVANSGLIDQTYSIYSRFSRIETDGYRDKSWSKLWSYFISANRFDENMTTRINIFGGPEQSFLSYKGIPAGQLMDESLRKINPIQYPGEIDNFYQPHIQVINEWQISSNIQLDNTFFVFGGKGDYTQYRTKRDVREYNMPRFILRDTTLSTSGYYKVLDKDAVLDSFQVRYVDLVRQRFVDEVDFGWLPRLTWRTESGEFVFGGELRRHRAHHRGEVIWASVLAPGTTPNWHYYDYVVPKTSTSLYLHRMYRLTPEIAVMGDIQFAYHHIELQDERNYNVTLTRDYKFLTPRIGANYNLSSKSNLFLNLSIAQREPAFKDIYDPQDYWSSPANLPLNFRQSASGYNYQGKELKPETFYNLEIGSGYSTELLAAKLNLFWMDFHDEIITNGQIDDNGVPIKGNADRSVHRGIEAQVNLNINSFFQLSGNISYNDNQIIRYTEYAMDWNTMVANPVKYDGNRLGGFPDLLGNLRLTFSYEGVLASMHLQHIGRIYIDNTERADNSINPNTILNAVISYNFGSIFGIRTLEARLNFNNITDVLYAAGGYVEEGSAYFIPAAGSNFFASVRVNL
jgi:iron complex outermembrane recepter protein